MSAGAAARRPGGLLLDFGGVIVESEYPDDWVETVAEEIAAELGGLSVPDHARIEDDLRAGAKAVGLWRNAMSRPMHPREIGGHDFVMDFVAADWPAQARARLEPVAERIAYRVAETKERRTLRDGIVELLDWCGEAGIPVAIVSNAMSGQVHRDYLAERGLSSRFAAELYSDECGIRKPNPEFLRLGADALGLALDDVWYVGDHYDRDVLCGVRAGVGATVLMPSPRAHERPFTVPVAADVVVGSPRELLETMRGIRVAA